jgi:hypothetical protein
VTARARVLLAVALSGVLLAGAAVYVLIAAHQRTAAAAATGLVDAGPGARLLFRSTAADSYGRVATVRRRFVTGDSYNGGKFSTRVGMLDIATGATVDTLETFAISRDGRSYRNVDVNLWGVTFADDLHFYATMSTAGHRYLVAGDITARTVRTLAANVECPSLSPDGTRLAFKQAVGGNPAKGWRLTVLDLATLRRTPLAESRSVDDQAAWLDNDTVMYAIRRAPHASDVWSVPASGAGTPTLLIPNAESPVAL